MTVDTTERHRATASAPVADAAEVAEKLAHHLAGHGARLEREPGRWVLDFALRRAEITLTPGGLDLLVEGRDRSLLHEMQLDLGGHLAEFGGPARLDWRGGAGGAQPPNFRLMRVTGVTDLTPHMRRIRLAGPDLLRFDTMEALHCKLILPPSDAAPVWPTLDEGRFRLGNGLVRKYTIRALDVAAGWMDVDFVVHEPAGPGSDWALRARPGDQIGLIGPGGGGIRLAGPLLLLGDETALPAIARALEAMPEGTPVRAFVEVAGPAEEQPVALRPGSQLRWLHRGPDAPGARLVEAIRAEAPDAGTLVWASCEMAAFRAIRRHLRNVLDHPRDRHLVTAYWRQGATAEGL